MAGNKAGGKKASATVTKKYGKDFYAKIGSKGGKVKNSAKGFGSNPGLASEAGKRGGQKSRKSKAKPKKILWFR